MSVEKEINKLLEQAQEMENTHNELALTEEDLELLSQEEIEALVENFEQLDEVSKKTLGSYISKASKEIEDNAPSRDKAHNMRLKDPDYYKRKGSLLSAREVAKNYDAHAAKRKSGMSKAIERLTKEDLDEMSQEEIEALVENFEQLDELSKKTLGSYIKKASENMAMKHGEEIEARNKRNNIFRKANDLNISDDETERVLKRQGADNKSMKELGNKKAKRYSGINKAIERLTKEDLDEMSQEDFDELVENFDQLDEISRATLSQYISSYDDTHDENNAGEKTNKAKGKIDSKDSNENTNSAKVATGPESKDFNIKKDVGFEKGDQTVAMESIDLGNLFEGHDLTEEFKTKATTIFESAVATRVADELAVREQELAEAVSEEMDELTEGLIDKIDGFLGYVAEQWLQKNELALDRGIKADLFESFVSGMKNLFEDHYINVPEEAFDTLDELRAVNEELEQNLNETTEHNIALSNTLKEISKSMQIEEAIEGLSDTQAEKFVKLAENIVFENEDSFAEKLEVIRENYFSTSTQKPMSSTPVFMSDAPVESINEDVTVNVDPTVAKYAKHML